MSAPLASTGFSFIFFFSFQLIVTKHPSHQRIFQFLIFFQTFLTLCEVIFFHLYSAYDKTSRLLEAAHRQRVPAVFFFCRKIEQYEIFISCFKSHKITIYPDFRATVPDTKRLLPKHHQIILLSPGNASLQVLYILCLSHFVLLVTQSACFSIPFPRASNNKRNTTHSFQRSHVAINFKLKGIRTRVQSERGEHDLINL